MFRSMGEIDGINTWMGEIYGIYRAMDERDRTYRVIGDRDVNIKQWARWIGCVMRWVRDGIYSAMGEIWNK